MFLKAFLDLLFPPLCHSCRVFIPEAGELHLCGPCRAGSRPITSPMCTLCGIPFLTDDGIDHRCGACLGQPPAYTAARGAVVFEGPVRELVHRFKYSNKVQHSRPLALLAAEHLAGFGAECAADMIMPVPLHALKLRQRGFNQAVLLGEILAKKWRLPLCRRNLQRARWTEPQVNLSAAERRRNVQGAFALSDAAAVNGSRIILVDDVFTTGSTVAECARVLKKGGAAAVFVVTVTRAVA